MRQKKRSPPASRNKPGKIKALAAIPKARPTRRAFFAECFQPLAPRIAFVTSAVMVQSVAIIDYGSGNLRSVEKALERAAREAGMACEIAVTDDGNAIAGADRVVLPGVGAFGACMSGLESRDGVIQAMEHAVLIHGRPFLGICVGMQLLADLGLEFGRHSGLGWIAGEVQELRINQPDLPTPHMGWSDIDADDHHPLLSGLDQACFYFAHSFHFSVANRANRIATCQYGGVVAAAVARDNIAGVQFHPEKSQAAGLALLTNFLTWSPS